MSPLKHKLYRMISRLWPARGDAPGLRVLLYHSVGAVLSDDPYGIGMDRALFEGHLALLDSLRSRFEPAPFGAPEAGRLRVAVTFDDGFKDNLTTAAPLLIERKLPFTVFTTSGFIRAGTAPYLKAAELKELALLPGAAIGSHGATHRRLTQLNDQDLKEELAGSRKYLEDLLGQPVTTLSYPHGDVDRRVRDAAREAGYLHAGCSRYGLNSPERDSLLLCRTELTAWDSVEDLRLKVSGAWDWFRFRHKDPAA